MASPSKKEWKNPKDVMRIHRIKRQSSVGLTRSKSASSINLNRRHSFNALSHNSENNVTPPLCGSKNDVAINSQSQAVGTQKRRNPFGCDSSLPTRSKRRSILDQDVDIIDSSATTTPLTDKRTPAVSEPACLDTSAHAAPVNEMDDHSSLTVGARQHKLLHVLNLAEQMSETKDDHLSQGTSENESQTSQIKSTLPPLPPPNVLREKPFSSNALTLPSDTSTLMQNAKVHPHPPLDWSLKSKLRVVVVNSMDTFKKYPGIDAKHVDSFVQHRLENDPGWSDLDLLQQIRRCCMHYSYPQLPWLSLFPRMAADFKSRSSTMMTGSEDVVEALHKDWSRTFTSVYQQLRGGLCPYFYICTHQFSVLFRCQRSSSHNASWSALLSPSTRGLREMLTKEGIDFRMPNIRASAPGTVKRPDEKVTGDGVCGNSNENNPTSPDLQSDRISSLGSTADGGKKEENKEDENEEEDDDTDDVDNHDGASRWLEGMGLDKRDFPSLAPLQVKLQREGFREIDNRPQSLVYVEGVDLHPFFNFLLNYPACIAASGPQHGIPPTILSPVPFLGGTLVQNTVKHTTLKEGLTGGDVQHGSATNRSTHVIEVSGPLLPHHTLNVASILHSCHSEMTSVSYNTHNPTAAFNTQTEHSVEKDKLASGLSKLFADFSLANPGLMCDVKNQLLSSSVLETGTAVRELNVTQKGFLWSC